MDKYAKICIITNNYSLEDQMSRKIVFLLILTVLFAQFTSSAAFTVRASGSDCPLGFTLEEVMPHENHEHQHVGTSADQNGDGFICVKHVTPDESIHVHIDNNVP